MMGVAMLVALEIDPSVVRPGWTPLIITILLAGVLVLLYRSMRRQFRKINVPPSDGARGRVSRPLTLDGADDAVAPRGRAKATGADKP